MPFALEVLPVLVPRAEAHPTVLAREPLGSRLRATILTLFGAGPEAPPFDGAPVKNTIRSTSPRPLFFP